MEQENKLFEVILLVSGQADRTNPAVWLWVTALPSTAQCRHTQEQVVFVNFSAKAATWITLEARKVSII